MEIEELIKGCAVSDRRAQSLLFDMYYSKMVGIASRYTNGSDDVEDLVQEAFISIYKNIAKFSCDSIHQLDYWVYNITKHKSFDLYRKNKGITKIELHDNLLNHHEDESFYDMFIDDIPTLIDNLSPKYQKVIILYYLEDKTHDEISKILGISVSLSKVNLLRGKKNMKKTLSRLYPSI
jgi:RNA polymerase sigma-70 factor (ECF subfamily)